MLIDIEIVVNEFVSWDDQNLVEEIIALCTTLYIIIPNFRLAYYLLLHFCFSRIKSVSVYIRVIQGIFHYSNLTNTPHNIYVYIKRFKASNLFWVDTPKIRVLLFCCSFSFLFFYLIIWPRFICMHASNICIKIHHFTLFLKGILCLSFHPCLWIQFLSLNQLIQLFLVFILSKNIKWDFIETFYWCSSKSSKGNYTSSTIYYCIMKTNFHLNVLNDFSFGDKISQVNWKIDFFFQFLF